MASKLFIVAVDDEATKEQCDAYTASMDTSVSIMVWHHISRFWIIRDGPGMLTAKLERDYVRRYIPTATIMVVELPRGIDWAAYLPKDSLEWLGTYFLDE